MATLRPVEERDSKGNTIRINVSSTFTQNPEIRKIVGRHDWQLIDNPDYHPPITAQVQNGRLYFFEGTPYTSASRALAKELPLDQVPAYIVENFKKHPMKVREQRPTVYEVKIATMGDVETTTVEEIANDGQSVTVQPVAPDLTVKPSKRAQANV